MKIKRRVAALLAAALFLCLPPTAAGADIDDYRDQLDGLAARYDQLEAEQKAIQKEIDRAKGEKEKKLAEKKQLDNQIYSVRQQIAVLGDKISLLDEHIVQRQIQLEEKQADIDENYALLKKRLRVMYTTGNATVLGLVLGADDFTEFLSRAQVASRVADHDRKLIERMSRELAAITKIKNEIEADRAEQEAARIQQADKQVQLAGQLAKTQDQIQDIAALEAEYTANKAKLKKEMDEVQAEVKAIYAAIESEGEYEGGIMLWPVAGYKTVTSDFGWRFGGTDYHTGIDIARTNAAGQGIYGKPILAASSGKVVFTQSSYVAGRGYGIYIIVDHGGGVSTLYGHASGLKAKVGDYVNRGDTIAYVGSTGWSTGPHLHFEVRINGVYTNPWPYLK